MKDLLLMIRYMRFSCRDLFIKTKNAITYGVFCINVQSFEVCLAGTMSDKGTHKQRLIDGLLQGD